MTKPKLDPATLRWCARLLRQWAKATRTERRTTDDIMDREYWSGATFSYAGAAKTFAEQASAHSSKRPTKARKASK